MENQNSESIRTKMILDPLNFHFESTYPLRDPNKEEMSVAGIVRAKLLNKFGESLTKAFIIPSKVNCLGRCHILSIFTSLKLLKTVVKMTYTGRRIKNANKIISSKIITCFTMFFL